MNNDNNNNRSVVTKYYIIYYSKTFMIKYHISQINYVNKNEFNKKFKSKKTSAASIGNRLGSIIFVNNIICVNLP